MSVEIEWDGQIWPSITAAARAEGVDRNTIRYWLDLKPSRPSSFPVTIRGRLYPSIAEAARQLGLARSTVRKAMLCGRLDSVGLGKN